MCACCLDLGKMQDADGPGTDAAWTQWKTLHHQTRDLSPWMTEAVSADHVRMSMRPENPPAYSVRASIPLQEARPIEQEEPRVGKHRIFWKRYIVAALVIRSASPDSCYQGAGPVQLD